jgi:predicted metal-binding protein
MTFLIIKYKTHGAEIGGFRLDNAQTVPKEKNSSEFDFLIKSALDLGAVKAKIIPASEIVVEDRVVLKCRVGCHMYGQKLVCPPFTPTVDEFRKMLKEYKYALLAKFKANAEAAEDVGRSLLRNEFDPATPKELREQALKFWSDWNADKRRLHLAALELEKAAFNRGYTLAVAFTAGSCVLCEKCNVKSVCVHPTMARYPEHALGVNMKKTAEKAGMAVTFPFQKRPAPILMVLID